jgi:hypothetical protein
MKKLLFSLATVLLTSAAAFSQNTTEVQVVVKNYTNYNIYFAPRYNLGYWDGADNTTFQGMQFSSLGGIPVGASDLSYQQEGQFEFVPPQTVKQYSNGGTALGVPLVPNSTDPVFNSTGTMMTGYQLQQSWFLKFMKLSWVRFAISKSTFANAAYGAALAYDFDPASVTYIPSTQPTPYYRNSAGEIFHTYGPSYMSFTAYGITFYGQFITAPASGSTPATIHIVFWQ